ncbi:uncharacterized protein QC761_104750 [Podospora bellae-mahoneyi]|uniref:Mid2 domain-containing protein n=1 Tax=Podospora bellae-mahoneyi TaxID=2093777 RepID=A0ABR0FV81_9PEZI|nr:hypothetical protein QC761_104750 [Podospora bellae-mahoneyi]
MMATLAMTSFPFQPLTTTYSRPPVCNGIYMPGNIWVMDNDPTCLPPGFDTESTSFFSPGIACPSGYWSACSDSKGVSTITTVTCCPIYRSDVSLSCVPSNAVLSGPWMGHFCTFKAKWTGNVVTVTTSRNGVTATETQTFISPQGINAFGVRMVHQTTDISPLNTQSTSNTDPPITTSSPTSQLGSLETSSSPDTAPIAEPAGSSLSTGAIAAIAVVIPILAILAGVGFFLWWRSRRALAASSLPESSPLGGPASESPGFGAGYPQQSGYTQQTSTYHGAGGPLPPQYGVFSKEMPTAYKAAVEMPGMGNNHVELPATFDNGPQELPTTSRQDRE